VNEYTKY